MLFFLKVDLSSYKVKDEVLVLIEGIFAIASNHELKLKSEFTTQQSEFKQTGRRFELTLRYLNQQYFPGEVMNKNL